MHLGDISAALTAYQEGQEIDPNSLFLLIFGANFVGMVACTIAPLTFFLRAKKLLN